MKYSEGPWKYSGPSVWKVKDEHHCVCVGVSTEANARLIAAAPELLEALRGLRDAFLGTSVEVQADAMRAARAAIAKAGGES